VPRTLVYHRRSTSYDQVPRALRNQSPLVLYNLEHLKIQYLISNGKNLQLCKKIF
jgi:hypothetical protein